MKVKIDRSELLLGLQRVQGAVEKRNTMPILSNILMEADSGKITLFGTDLDLGVKTSHPTKITEAGGVAVSARKLYEIVRELPDGQIEMITTDKNWLKISAGKIEFRITGLQAQEFPAIPSIEPEQMIPIGRNVLIELIRKTVFAVGDNDARYILNGLLLHMYLKEKNWMIRLVGTDGHRLAIIDRGLPQGKGTMKEATAIIPKKAALEMKRLLEENEEEPTLGITRNQIIFRRGNVLLFSRLMEGNYPNYQQVIPKENHNKVVALRSLLEGALRRVSLMAKEKTNAVRMSLEPDTMILSSNNPEMGEARESIPVKYHGDKLETGFNSRYLLDALGGIEGDEALLELKESASPCIIRQEGDEGYFCVVMPMRV